MVHSTCWVQLPTRSFPQLLTGSSFSEKQEYYTKMLLPCLSYVQLLELRLYSKRYKSSIVMCTLREIKSTQLTDLSNLHQLATTMSQTDSSSGPFRAPWISITPTLVFVPILYPTISWETCLLHQPSLEDIPWAEGQQILACFGILSMPDVLHH